MPLGQRRVRGCAWPRKNRLVQARITVMYQAIEEVAAAAALECVKLLFIEQAKPI